MHVNPITSDGQFTIGYDADGLAGQWPGNMTQSCETADFMIAREGQTFADGSEEWDAVWASDDTLVWRDPEGDWIDPDEILKRYGIDR